MRKGWKSVSLILMVSLIFTVSVSMTASAAPTQTYSSENVGIKINGKFLSESKYFIDDFFGDAVSVKGIFENLGYKVTVDSKTKDRVLKKGSTTIKLFWSIEKVKDKKEYIFGTVNGKKVTFPALPSRRAILYDDFVIPLVYLEALGVVNVRYDKNKYVLSIWEGNVKYGRHIYETTEAQEYEKVLEIIDRAIASFDPDNVSEYEKYYFDYLKGDRASNYEERTRPYIGLTQAEKALLPAIKAGASIEEIETAYKGTVIANNLVKPAAKTEESYLSVYDILVNQKLNSYSKASLVSAVLDSLGFNTALMTEFNYAKVIFQVKDSWIIADDSYYNFESIDIEDVLSKGYYISQPTYGHALTLRAIENAKYGAENVGVKINGSIIALSPQAIVKGDITFIPLRGVFEKLGASIGWEQSTNTVTITKDKTVIKLVIGSKTATIDGKKRALTTAPFTIDGSTFVPLRFASESLGASVEWDAKNWIASINIK